LHSNTFTGNALAVAVALAVLDVFADDDILGRVATMGPRLAAIVQKIAADRTYLRNVRACGMVAAVDIRAADGTVLDPGRRTGWHVYREAVRRGALLRSLGDTMYLFPPLTTTEGELNEICAILGDSLDGVIRQ
jgi:adenosylmethionine-8-amino-7-oxononanoate aminotransferase